jgi:cytochrome P450
MQGASRAAALDAQRLESGARDAEEALRKSSAATPALRDRTAQLASAAREALRALRAAVRGMDAETAGTAPPLDPLISQLYSAAQASTGPLTDQQRAQMAQARERLDGVIRDLQQLRLGVPNLQRLLQDAGISWTAPDAVLIPSIRSGAAR